MQKGTNDSTKGHLLQHKRIHIAKPLIISGLQGTVKWEIKPTQNFI